MILTCPSCGTQYVVKDGAIPPGGRQVRCASCKHSWHQDPEGESGQQEEAAVSPEPPEQAQVPVEPVEPVEAVAPEAAEAEPSDEDEDEDDESETIAEATLIEPRSGPEAEERAFEEAAIEGAEESYAEGPVAGGAASVQAQEADDAEPQPAAVSAEPADWREPPQAEAADDEFTPFPAVADDRRRARSPLLTILIVVLVVVALAAAFWFLAPPDLKARLGLGGVGATPLALVTTHMDRQRLESGNELLTVTGRVINPTSKEQAVPPLQAQLRTKAGAVVYSWTIAPPAKSLPAGASASFNSAEVNVPPGGDELTITLGANAG